MCFRDSFGFQKLFSQIPLIVRLSGTNVEEGIKIVKDSGLPIILADTLKDAAQKAVDAAKQ